MKTFVLNYCVESTKSRHSVIAAAPVSTNSAPHQNSSVAGDRYVQTGRACTLRPVIGTCDVEHRGQVSLVLERQLQPPVAHVADAHVRRFELGRDEARYLLARPAPYWRLRVPVPVESGLDTAQKVGILEGIDDKRCTLALRFSFKNRVSPGMSNDDRQVRIIDPGACRQMQSIERVEPHIGDEQVGADSVEMTLRVLKRRHCDDQMFLGREERLGPLQDRSVRVDEKD